MKILLLSVNSYTFFYSQLVVPFGLLSLGSYVQEDGHVIKGIEMNSPLEMIPNRYLKADQKLLDEIVQFNPDLVAMSTYASNIHNVLFWSDIIKKSLPQTHIAVGGNHASYMAKEILEKCPAIDFIVKFEGEIPFRQICNKIEKGDKNYRDVPNLVFRQNGEIIENPICDLIKDLDCLPLMNPGLFAEHTSSLFEHADMVTARGCPFNCTFCNCNHYWGKKYRTFSVERVIKELKNLKEKNPNLKTVRFRDESISIDKRRCLKLCQALVEHNINLKFHAHSRLDGLDEEVISHLAKAGFEQLFIGLESGSPSVLERLKKGINPEKVYAIVPLLRKYHISFRFSLMLATPDETTEEVMQTIELVNALKLSLEEFYFGFGITVYPGTSDCNRFLKKFPDYKWLERNKLGYGYSQAEDCKGNVVAVSFHGARNSVLRLKDLVNKNLKPRLLSDKEGNYFHRNFSLEAVNRMQKHKEQAEQNLKSLLGNIDNSGGKWGIYRKGIYYDKLLADICAEGNFKNFAGIFSPLPEGKDSELSELRQKLQSIKYLVLAVSEEEAYENLTQIYLRGNLQFKNELLVADRLIKENRALNSTISELIRAIRLEPIYYYKAVTADVLKKIGLYPTAIKLIETFRAMNN
ncbi:MAG: B12-binding domain-containing radical SAM protein [Candidatus Schekmanbacteria bacterium]|nr:B12-binding domain-containing radical SAM protein [Candidatus Schekmanbacteria bacterium]